MNVYLILLCLIWGFNWVFMKLGMDYFAPVQFAAYRFALGAIVLFPLCLYRKVPMPKPRDLMWYIVCGILQTAYFNIAIQLSLRSISAGLTSVLTYSMPLWLAVMAHYALPGEKLNGRKIAGLLAGVIGLFFAMDAHFGGNIGMLLLALSSGLSWALSNLIIKRKLSENNNLQFTTWQMAAGALGLIVYSLIFERGQAVHWDAMGIVYVCFAGIVASAFAFILWFRILSGTEANKASVSLFLVPIIGVLSGWLVLHERLNMATLIGIAFVLAGIWLVNSKPKAGLSMKRKREETSSH